MACNVERRYFHPMKSANLSIGRATLLIVISAISFGSISVLTVLTSRAGVPLVTAMAWRYVIAAAVLATSVRRDVIQSIPRRRVIELLLVGGFGQALITYLSLYSLNYIAVGPLAFLFYTYPAWVAVLAAVTRTERLSPVRMMALVLALLGVTIMVGAPTETLNRAGVALAVGSAILYSLYLPALQHLQYGVPPMSCRRSSPGIYPCLKRSPSGAISCCWQSCRA
jgi:drug/metabolite transporter (DMT)-like permease